MNYEDLKLFVACKKIIKIAKSIICIFIIVNDCELKFIQNDSECSLIQTGRSSAEDKKWPKLMAKLDRQRQIEEKTEIIHPCLSNLQTNKNIYAVIKNQLYVLTRVGEDSFVKSAGVVLRLAGCGEGRQSSNHNPRPQRNVYTVPTTKQQLNFNVLTLGGFRVVFLIP